MITPCSSPHQPGWLALRKALWPHPPDTDHLEEMAALLAQPERYAQYITHDEHGHPIDFIELSPATTTSVAPKRPDQEC